MTVMQTKNRRRLRGRSETKRNLPAQCSLHAQRNLHAPRSLHSQRSVRARGKWLAEMMSEERLSVVFQPIARAHDLQPFGQECLLRGWDADALISPERLFHAARLMNLTSLLDLQARMLALKAASHHAVAEKLFINFVPCFGGDPLRALRRTCAQLDHFQITREQIVFEITETECVRDFEECLHVLRAYRDCGFRLALDDAGAGYSSLKLLAALQPDILKIDAGLLRDVHLDRSKAIVARKLLETARELDIQSVAEGIESEAEYFWVRDNGADFVQGFYFAVPSAVPSLPAPLCDRPAFA